jgi:hypothetical protein
MLKMQLTSGQSLGSCSTILARVVACLLRLVGLYGMAILARYLVNIEGSSPSVVARKVSNQLMYFPPNLQSFPASWV